MATFAFALEYTSDIQATKRFCVDVLGLQIDREAPDFVQFKTGNGANYAIASDARMDDKATGPELWWLVDDAETSFKVLSAQARTTTELRQMPFGKCFGVQDPGGQVHYLLQFAPQRPSQPVA